MLSYIDVAKNEGAKLRMGGGPATRPECGKGWFVEPHHLHRRGQQDAHRAGGSLRSGAVDHPFKDEDDAVRIANDVRFGLGAGVWTRDVGRAIRMSERIQAGTVWVNTYRAVSFMSPFGGYKDSGIGRENGQSASTSTCRSRASGSTPARHRQSIRNALDAYLTQRADM